MLMVALVWYGTDSVVILVVCLNWDGADYVEEERSQILGKWVSVLDWK